MTTTLLIVGLIMAAAALALSFLPWRWSAAAAYAALVMCYFGCPGVATWKLLVFWGIAAVLVVALNRMLPAAVSTSRAGNGYIVTGGVMGLVTGFVISPSWMVIGSCIGAVLGAFAYSRTPRGATLGFPSSKFVQYLCAKGLPSVVTLSIIGYTVLIAVEAYAR